METYYGVVRSPADAIKLFEACRLGHLPRVQRRLSEKERQAIRSGSVFVWDEREAGMRRWTDGKSWSASRVSGSFLTYREMEGKRGSGFGGSRRGAGKTPDSGRGSDEDQDDGEPDGYRYKADGLMKQSFSITTSNNQHLHLISYFSRGQQDLLQPSNDPNLRNIVPAKGMYPESSMNDAPVPTMTRTSMQQPPYGQHQHQHHHQHQHQHQLQHQHPGHPHQGYHSQYSQPAYNNPWPPSPVATPPYSHGHYTTTLPPYPQGQSLPPPPHAYAHQQQQQQQQQPQQQQQQQQHAALQSPHMSQAARMSPLGSPRSQQLQAQAREAVLIDPRLAANSSRNSQGPLPTPRQQPSQNGPLDTTPPPRTQSVSPSSRSSYVEPAGTNGSAPVTNKASLSALLLHPTPTNSEPNSANPGTNSANSSPRAPSGAPANGSSATAAGQQKRMGMGMEDARAIGVLDKKFCI
ncbi:Gti1/Pac2 family-domain-containing protein [Lasiosphaeria miniovina]|uniref:Gti1/Pac2 family-domain-containing protein n=1 Tax=Lasiosphaeria miniovina TaxID=1954250 RepID=A0AA40DR44_9PEZI|nr:Gti1/Pac2 family-domain-containing protein [Lasiosphaeria miniovina]KAK0713059.1 Gti1/Pac2 family-domain-containing protein [Lasiosphaeria miniovina]